jgi:hypothetical protein
MASFHYVVYSEIVRAKLRTYLDEAAEEGRGEEALVALKAIDDALRTDPAGFGDPWYELPNRTQRIMNRAFPPWFVVYGIHSEKRVVFVRSITPCR